MIFNIRCTSSCTRESSCHCLQPRRCKSQGNHWHFVPHRRPARPPQGSPQTWRKGCGHSLVEAGRGWSRCWRGGTTPRLRGAQPHQRRQRRPSPLALMIVKNGRPCWNIVIKTLWWTWKVYFIKRLISLVAHLDSGRRHQRWRGDQRGAWWWWNSKDLKNLTAKWDWLWAGPLCTTHGSLDCNFSLVDIYTMNHVGKSEWLWGVFLSLRASWLLSTIPR